MRDFTYIQEHVTKSLHGKNTGPWSLGFKVYRDVNHGTGGRSNPSSSLSSAMHHQQSSQGKDNKLMYQVTLGQQPGQVYCMVDGSVVVEAEKELEIILSRLKNLWQMRQSVMIEVSMTLLRKHGLFIPSLRVQALRLVISRCESPIFFLDRPTKDYY